MLVGCIATLVAFIGVVLPGLPTTPFLLIALWAFARSSQRLHDWLVAVPILQTALTEAKRFEEKRTMRLEAKVLALTFAWCSVGLTALMSNGRFTIVLLIVICAALAATASVWIIPTDRE